MGNCLKAILVVILTLILTVNCYAEDGSKYYSDFLNIVPDEYSDVTQQEVFELVSVKNVLNNIFKVFLKDIKNALKLTASLISLLLAVSLIKRLDFENKSLKQTLYGVFSVVGISIYLDAIKISLDVIQQTVDSSKVFSYSSIPIILALCISSASSMSGAVFSTSVSFISALTESVSDNLLIPLCVVFLSFALINNFSTYFDFGAINNQIKKFIKWIIGIFTTLFSFTMIIQNFLSASSDSVLKQSIKSAVGSFVPVVGSTLSSSVDSIFTILSNIKTTVGVFGIFIVFITFLPSLSCCLCYGFTLSVSKFFALSLGEDQFSRTIGIISDFFYILAAICCSCMIMMILSFLVICLNIV